MNKTKTTLENMLTDDSVMKFGMHKGKKMEEIPDEYLIWFWKENVDAFQSTGGSRLNNDQNQVMEYIKDFGIENLKP